MAGLDGLIRAALAGTTGFMAGRNVLDERERQEAARQAEQQAELKRQAEQDALRAALLNAQTDANEALAEQRRRTETPTPARVYDPNTDIETQRESYYKTHRLGRYSTPTTTDLAPGQARTARDMENKGQAVLMAMGASGTASMDLKRAFWRAWTDAYRHNPKQPKGTLAVQTLAGLRSTLPELFREPDTDSADGALDAGDAVNRMVAERTAIYRLMAGGMSRDDAERQVYGAPRAHPTPATTVQPGYTPEARARFNAGQGGAAATAGDNDASQTTVSPAQYDYIVQKYGEAYARQHFTAGTGPTPSALDPAVRTEARQLIEGSANPRADLQAAGFTDAEIQTILGSD
jgi:hypothetical protein